MLSRLRLSFSIAVASALLTVASLVASPQAPAAAQETSAASVASYALSQQMPVDPEVVVGTLPNGLRYYVRPNGKPARRAELMNLPDSLIISTYGAEYRGIVQYYLLAGNVARLYRLHWVMEVRHEVALRE